MTQNTNEELLAENLRLQGVVESLKQQLEQAHDTRRRLAFIIGETSNSLSRAVAVLRERAERESLEWLSGKAYCDIHGYCGAQKGQVKS